MPPKHSLEATSSGPYVVVGQSSLSSVRLKDPATGEMVADGADIPLEQILAGPRRGHLHFESVDDGRSVGEMIRGEKILPPAVVDTGWKKPETKKRGSDESIEDST